MTAARLTAEFVGEPDRRIFVLAHHPESFNGRCVLVCPPFAEEMNKSRRMLTELAGLLASRGVALVIPDLYGTGDSEGDFSDATWGRWLADLATSERWIEARGWRVDAMLGIRLGCVLAAQYAATRTSPLNRTVFWQPVTEGARALDQFLRLRVAASLMSDVKETTADLKARFAAGEAVEVAGYAVAPALARELEQASLLKSINRHAGTVHWFEVLRAADAPLPVPAVKAMEQLRQQLDATLHPVVGEPFWATTEVMINPALLAETAASLAGASS